ncbi:MAG: sigma-54-dependent Fis family transcriptional regulator [Candidatus Scalindua sp.]|jgi:two-component system response regulator AtoC|nr:sigma-54-dependent Fis family transcriptional regulator [Candidatus Scalindua sp.]MBT5307061.1 sigma-54-dependent Fis family transcriptional regulator [Candidatus Scalindua sp.]MBT6047565.1 sigma-54-dependent Fis family transcriptional regulator [Candidatus Scalindua sp.]MBT6227021.1 sigma-54-dependent Fis family transcriptional regulator [Candidatus Scalindua sp.]MBT6562679.1 sigma-54-dependent Fis family transcriptional regulator [Candidatus Scalindua sp.]
MTQENIKPSLSESKGHILVIEDDDNIRSTFASYLEDFGYQVKLAKDGNDAIALVDQNIFDIALLDICTHDHVDIDLLKEIKKILPRLEIIVCTDYSKNFKFFDAFKAGAADWISKPINLQELHAKVERIRKGQNHLMELSKKTYALEKIKAETEQVLKNMKLMLQEKDGFAMLKRTKRRSDFPEIISNSKKIEYVLELVQLVAITDSSVLITGESGTGKELIARAIHRLSNRVNSPFVPVNCGALTDTLLDSELFGHERGAFTGAVSEKQGLVEEAEGGTLFLDEIDASPPQLQVKLLRILQEGEFKRVGSTKYRHANIRIITATNVSLEKSVRDGDFREDLYYRLNQFLITLPPLRDRIDDILLLGQYSLEQACLKFSKELVGFSPDVIEKFLRYTWPGNVRELENVVSQAVIMASPPTIELKDVSALTDKLYKYSRKTRLSDKPFSEAKNEFERRYFKNVLERTNGNISAASRFSKVDRKQLREKIRKFGIDSMPYTQQA